MDPPFFFGGGGGGSFPCPCCFSLDLQLFCFVQITWISWTCLLGFLSLDFQCFTSSSEKVEA